MTKLVLTLLAFGALALAPRTSSTAHAQALRTWISGVGDDANPCSRSLPCKTFAGAIAKTVAGGIIDALDPGSFGAVTITKSITLDGCCLADIYAVGANAITIAAGPTDIVNLRHLDLQGGGLGVNGIKITSAGSVVIEDCAVYGFGGGAGLSDTRAATGNVVVRNTVFKQNGLSGVTIAPTAPGVVTALFENCTFEGNMGAGLSASQSANVTVSRSTSVANFGAGFKADGSVAAAVMLIQSCVSSNNATGILAINGGTVTVGDTQITANAIGITAAAGGAALTYGNNQVSGGAGAFTGTIAFQ